MNLKKTGAEVELCLKWLCSSDQNVVIDKEINDILSLLTDEHCVWPAGVNVDRLKTVFVEPPPRVMNPLGTWTTYSNRRREKVVSYCEMLLNDGHEKEFLDFIIDLFECVKNDFITVGVISPADRACNTDNEIDFNPSGIIQALLSATTLGFFIRQSVANGKITSDKTLAVLSRIVAVLGHYCFRILEPCKNVPPTGYFNDMKDFASGELSQLAAAMKQTSLSFEEVGKIYKSALAVRHPDWYNVQKACHPDHAKETMVKDDDHGESEIIPDNLIDEMCQLSDPECGNSAEKDSTLSGENSDGLTDCGDGFTFSFSEDENKGENNMPENNKAVNSSLTLDKDRKIQVYNMVYDLEKILKRTANLLSDINETDAQIAVLKEKLQAVENSDADDDDKIVGLTELQSEIEALQSLTENKVCVKLFHNDFPDESLFSGDELKKYYSLLKSSECRGDYDVAAHFAGLMRKEMSQVSYGVPAVLSENITGSPALQGCSAAVENDCEVEVIAPSDDLIIQDNVVTGIKDKNAVMVTVPSGITVIGKEAFAECSALEAVFLPESVEEIREKAFYRCDKLSKINIPAGVRKIACATFAGCSNLSDIKLPAKLHTIDAYAFSRCNNKLELFIPQEVKSIGAGAFCHCFKVEIHPENRNFKIGIKGEVIDKHNQTLIYFPSHKKGHYIVPQEIKVIGEKCFYESDLESIDIGPRVKTIRAGAFLLNKNISSLEIPDNVSEIGNGAFSHMGNLKKMKFPDSLTEIGENLLECCHCLCEVEIPGSVKKIGNDAFRFCTDLKRVKMSENTVFYHDTFVNTPFGEKYRIPSSEIYSMTTSWLPDGTSEVSLNVRHFYDTFSPSYKGLTLKQVRKANFLKDLKAGLKNMAPLLLLVAVLAILALIMIITDR